MRFNAIPWNGITPGQIVEIDSTAPQFETKEIGHAPTLRRTEAGAIVTQDVRYLGIHESGLPTVTRVTGGELMVCHASNLPKAKPIPEAKFTHIIFFNTVVCLTAPGDPKHDPVYWEMAMGLVSAGFLQAREHGPGVYHFDLTPTGVYIGNLLKISAEDTLTKHHSTRRRKPTA